MKTVMLVTASLLMLGTVQAQTPPTTTPVTSTPATSTAASATATVQTLTPVQTLERVFSAPAVQAAWFAPELLAKAPFTSIKAEFDGIRVVYGAFQRVEQQPGGALLVIFEKGRLQVTSLLLDDQGRFKSILLAPVSDVAEEQAVALLTKLFQADTLDSTLFSAAFLTQVPEQQLKGLFQGLWAQSGKLLKVTPQQGNYRLTFERDEWDVVSFGLDEQGKINALQLKPVVKDVQFKSFTDARAAFAALPGKVSLLVRELGQPPVVNLNGAQRLAVASSAKLAILGELQAQVKAGKRKWTDELALLDADKALPSGTLQNARTGSKYTLSDLATRMIRDSDNTATNMLLRLVGRAGVEARFGQQPFFSTREMFILKAPANAALLGTYRKALDLKAKRAVLTRTASLPLPDVKTLDTHPTALDIEWFASTEHLCRLMADVANLTETRQNPGVANPLDFKNVSFKGGSEPGVIQLTTQLTTKNGKTYCLSATWNNEQGLSEQQFIDLYSGVLKLLR